MKQNRQSEDPAAFHKQSGHAILYHFIIFNIPQTIPYMLHVAFLCLGTVESSSVDHSVEPVIRLWLS